MKLAVSQGQPALRKALQLERVQRYKAWSEFHFTSQSPSSAFCSAPQRTLDRPNIKLSLIMGDNVQTIPSDMVAVFDKSEQQWWIYYVSSDGKVRIIEGPTDGQVENSEDNPPYKRTGLSTDGKNIPGAQAGNPQLGVVDYLDNSGAEQVSTHYPAKLEMGHADIGLKDSCLLSRYT